MENDNSKILTVSFVIAGVVGSVIMVTILDFLATTFGAVARLYAQDAFRHSLTLGSGILIFALLQFNPKVRVYCDEVVTEVRKVVFPSRKDTTGMTIVVSIMLIFSGVALGLFDYLSNWAVKMLIKMGGYFS